MMTRRDASDLIPPPQPGVPLTSSADDRLLLPAKAGKAKYLLEQLGGFGHASGPGNHQGRIKPQR